MMAFPSAHITMSDSRTSKAGRDLQAQEGSPSSTARQIVDFCGKRTNAGKAPAQMTVGAWAREERCDDRIKT